MSRAHRAGTSTEWRNLRIRAFTVYGKNCLICGERATEIDHIIELAAGGTNSLDNLQPLCKPCHKQKTANFNKSPVFSKAITPPTLFPASLSLLQRIDPPTSGNTA